MKFRLVCHPLSSPGAVRAIGADVRIEASGEVRIRYTVKGDLESLSLAEPRFPGRADNLWKTTCFELFVRPVGQTDYFEFNFSPSGEWAAYGFSDYREGMSELTTIMPPRIMLRTLADKLELSAFLSPGLLTHWPEWDVGLSAVIQTTTGATSYWALAHPPGRPDFHHQHCFRARLSPTVGA